MIGSPVVPHGFPTRTKPTSTQQRPMPNEEMLREFIAWYETKITGDEKGEAQVFLDRLFKAFGQGGTLDVGGKPEFRVRKSTQDGGGISFADYVWKPIVLIEMKKRGTSLQKHRKQAFEYWTNLVPNRPQYVVLCNFDEFWIYDFDTDLDEPKDKVTTKELADRWGPLAFIAPGTPNPVFRIDRVAVTQDAADVLAQLLNSLLEREVDRKLAQHFLVQNLIALFSEDIGLLPKYFYTQLVQECVTPAQAYDLIGGLFESMNKPIPATGGRFKGIPYFNGGVFADPARVELTTGELDLIKKATEYDWSKVQPEIFGTLFQHSLDEGERRALGAHFTHPADIMKIVGPTIVQPWRERVESAKTLTSLNEALTRLHNYRVLDPACGSGNFLYIAYRELKRIEARIIERAQQEFKSEAKKAAQLQLSFLSAKNFYGIDIHPLAIDIAKVTMVIARKLANNELHFTEPALPLDNLDSNFQAADALLTASGTPTTWPTVDVIIGNPPFTGAKRLKPQRGRNYVETLRKAYPKVPGMADYCVYWFRKAHDHLHACTKSDSVSGRAGLVGTQNIRNNQSRIGGLDHAVASGTILDAVDNQPWSGEANVNVSIVNWAKTQEVSILPKQRRLWFKVDPTFTVGRPPDVKPTTDFDLDYRDCKFINSSLTDATDVSGAISLKCNVAPQRVFQGVTPGHSGFVLAPAEQKALIAKDPASASVVFPYLVGRELVSGDGQPKRFIIDFGMRTVLEAQALTAAFARVKAKVLPDRQKKAEEGRDEQGNYQLEHKQAIERWWRLWRDRDDMKQAFVSLNNRYVAGSRTQRWPFIFCFVSKGILPGDKLQTFAFDDDYSFGVLQGAPHLAWYAAKAARLKNEEDYNYSTESVFDTYPWPQTPTKKQIEVIAAASVNIRQIRAAALPVKGGLRGLYSSLSLPGANPLKNAHRDLDDALMDAYGFSKKKDLLSQLLDLNAEVAARIRNGDPVLGPGIPANYAIPSRLISSDYVR
jgi:hypothetical protein